MPDTLSEIKSYAVEHYRPKKQFPHLTTDYSNLYYSCCDCNSKKGSFWPNEDQTKQGLFIPNPCDYTMHDHLRTQSEGVVKPHSFAGQWTIDMLDLNSPARIKKRQAFLNLHSQLTEKIKLLQTQLSKLKKIEKAAKGSKLATVKRDISEIESALTDCLATNEIFTP